MKKQQVLGEVVEKKETWYVGGNADSVATVENSMEFLQKTKNGTAFWPSNSIAGIIP